MYIKWQDTIKSRWNSWNWVTYLTLSFIWKHRKIIYILNLPKKIYEFHESICFMITIHKNLSKYFRYIHVHFLRLFCAHQIAYNFPRNTFSNLIKYMYTTTCATSTGNIILIYHMASRVTCQNISPAVTRKPRCVVSMMHDIAWKFIQKCYIPI